MTNDKILYTHGVSGWGTHIVVEGKIATQQQIKEYRQKLLEKASKEINGNNPYKDGDYLVRKLHDTYNRDLKSFVPSSDLLTVWMRDPDNIFEEKELAIEYVKIRNEKLSKVLRDMMQCDISAGYSPVGLEYYLKYSYED